jgi:hypothetical protein
MMGELLAHAHDGNSIDQYHQPEKDGKEGKVLFFGSRVLLAHVA